MKKHILIILGLTLFYSFKPNAFIGNIDKIFISWNTLTFNSINSQTIKIKESKETEYVKELYESRLKSFKASKEINNLNHINKESIRYKFLKKISEDNLFNNNFYIIEADRSGEMIELINYLAIPIENNQYQIFRYNYNLKNKDWEKVLSKKIPKNEIGCLSNCQLPIGDGNNHEDVIITHIVNKVVKFSTFYLTATCSIKLPEYD